MQGNYLGMASLDVDSFCTNVPLDETIVIYIKNFLELGDFQYGIFAKSFYQRIILFLTCNNFTLN